MTRALLVLSLLALGVAGCRRHGPPTIRAAGERELRRLERVGANDLDCPDVRLSQLTETAFQVIGCGRTAEYYNVCTGRRCHWETMTNAGAIATALMGCPVERLEAEPRSATRLEIHGCGLALVLDLSCLGDVCAWTPRAPPPPRVPPDEPLFVPALARAADDGEIRVPTPPP